MQASSTPPGRLALAVLALLAAVPARAQTAPEEPLLPGTITERADSEIPASEENLRQAQQSLAQARNEAETLRALAALANLQRRRGDYANGLASARDGLARAERLGDRRGQVEFLYLLGRIHWNLTDYPRSLEHHLAELKISQQLGDAGLLARTHGGLGLTYQRFGRIDEALEHFAQGLKFAAAANDERMRASILSSLGNHFLAEHNYARAGELHREALALREKFGNPRAIADSLTNVGLVADAQGDSAQALAYLRRALTTYESLGLKRYITNTHRRLGTVLRNSGHAAEALAELELALRLAEPLGSTEVLAAIYPELALTCEALGDFPRALAFQRKATGAAEAMRGEQDRQRMSELRERYRAEQRELEIALLRRDQELQTAEIRRQRSQTFALAAGLIGGVTVLGAIILVQVVRLRSERRMHAATEHARERAAAAERLKSRLLQMASHDLKVPLTALNATARLIGDAPGDPATVTRLVGGIQADTARMRNLVRDFLDAAAIEDGNLQLHTTELDLAAVAGAAVESLGPVATAKGQTLSLQPAPQALPSVEADADRLRQVFDNLIGNAVKFTPPGGAITVALGEAGAWAFAEVRDTGPGLGPADFAKIFAPRQRLSATPTGGEDSSGLGLFIARELLTLQGGRLEVQSLPGRGATFRVLLPVALPRAT